METLSSRVSREGPLEAADAVGWAVRLARRIESLHALGVAHGNISAECVVIEGSAPSSRGVLADVRRARPGRAYQSPERIAGGGISQLDDAWAIGVTLYLTLTGTLPFLASSEEELGRKIAACSPSPLAVFDVGDDQLQRAFDRIFARDPRGRVASVAALRRDLTAWRPAPANAFLPPLDEEEDEEEEPAASQPAPSAPPTGLMEDDDQAATVARGPSAAQEYLAALVAARQGPAAGAPAPPRLAALSSTTPMQVMSPVPRAQTPAPPPTRDPEHRGYEGPAGTFVMSGEQRAAMIAAADLARASYGRSSPIAATLTPDPRLATPIPPAAPALAPAPLAVPVAKRGKALPVVVALLVVVAIAASFLAWRHRRLGQLPPSPTAAPPSQASAPAPSGAPPTPSAIAAVSVPRSSASAAIPQADAAPHPGADLAACVRAMAAEGTFDASPSPDFAPVCAERDPKKNAEALRTQIVAAGGGKRVSEGMREWAVLGWYDLAAIAAVRGRCCPGAPAISTGSAAGDCKLDAALNELSSSAAKGFAPDEKALDDALAPFTKSVHCILRAKLGDRFGKSEPIQGGEATAAKKTLARARKP